MYNKMVRASASVAAAVAPADRSPQDSADLGEITPVSGLNYMEEQYVKYGNNLGNYHPPPIIGTDSMASVYKSHNLTPAEQEYFFNWQSSGAGGQPKMLKYKPRGIDYKLYGDRFHQGAVLEDHERLVEYTRNHGTTSANQIRNQRIRGIQQGPWSNTFPCSG